MFCYIFNVFHLQAMQISLPFDFVHFNHKKKLGPKLGHKMSHIGLTVHRAVNIFSITNVSKISGSEQVQFLPHNHSTDNHLIFNLSEINISNKENQIIQESHLVCVGRAKFSYVQNTHFEK